MIEIDTQRPEYKRKPSGRNVDDFVLYLFFIAGCSFGLANSMFHPLRAYETIIYVTILTSPLWLGFGSILYKKIDERLPAGTLIENGGMLLGFILYLSLILLCLSTTYSLNALLDESKEQHHEHPITDKNESHGKYGTGNHAEVPTFTPNIFSFFILDTFENIGVTKDVYNHLEINKSIGIITYKSGRYNIPWKISGYVETQRKTAAVAPYMQRFIDASRDPDYVQGLSYFTGKGQAKNDALAVEAFKLAASRGNALAEHDLAYMLMNGQGIPKDTHAAAQLVWQSAQQGYALAQDYLGVMYGDGINGIPQDWVQSYIWINRAAKQGYDQAIKDLDYAKSHMTHEQIEHAEQQTNQPASSSTIR